MLLNKFQIMQTTLNRISICLLTLIMLLSSVVISAQVKYTLNHSKSDMRLSGTSTMHDWTMIARGFNNESIFTFVSGKDKELNGVHSLTFSLPAENLKSDKKGLDKNAYKALKTDQHKSISYKLSSAKVTHLKDQTYQVAAVGNLSIAGVTKSVTIMVNCTVNADNSITCSGSQKLKLTDFDITPPSFMMGAMKTGNDVVLDFSLNYIQ